MFHILSGYILDACGEFACAEDYASFSAVVDCMDYGLERCRDEIQRGDDGDGGDGGNRVYRFILPCLF